MCDHFTWIEKITDLFDLTFFLPNLHPMMALLELHICLSDDHDFAELIEI